MWIGWIEFDLLLGDVHSLKPSDRPDRASSAYTRRMASIPQTITRTALGGALLFTGVAHLTFARRGFRVAVPEWVPGDPDTTVVASGWVEIVLGAAMLVARGRRRLVGRLVAWFLVAVFPGNVTQWTHHRNAPGLDTEMKRFGRLFLQPVLIVLALWSTRERRG